MSLHNKIFAVAVTVSMFVGPIATGQSNVKTVNITFPVGTNVYYDNNLNYHCDRDPLSFVRYGGLMINTRQSATIHLGGLYVPRIDSDNRYLRIYGPEGPFALHELVAVESPFESSAPTGMHLVVWAQHRPTGTVFSQDFFFDLDNTRYDVFRPSQVDSRFSDVNWATILADTTIGVDNVAYILDKVKTSRVLRKVGPR